MRASTTLGVSTFMGRFLQVMWLLSVSNAAFGFTANKVWMEFRSNGRYRVFVNYTVPELRQFREAYVDFSKKEEAEKYFFDLVKGADFYFPNAKERKFAKPVLQAQPW